MAENLKTISENRQVRHEYFIIESLEAGIELTGTEVKSIRQGGVNLRDSWIEIEKGEAYVKQMHISPYEKGNIFNKDPLRERRLLMHKHGVVIGQTTDEDNIYLKFTLLNPLITHKKLDDLVTLIKFLAENLPESDEE